VLKIVTAESEHVRSCCFSLQRQAANPDRLDAVGNLLLALPLLFPLPPEIVAPLCGKHWPCHLLHYAGLPVFIKYPQSVALLFAGADRIINSHGSGKVHSCFNKHRSPSLSGGLNASIESRRCCPRLRIAGVYRQTEA